MTPEERQVLQQFLSDLQGSRGAQKDPEADGMIADALRRNPDAAYLLVQHAILADQALQAAQQQIQALESQGQGQGQEQPPAPSFFGGGQPAPQAQGYGRQGYGQAGYGQAGYGQPASQGGYWNDQPPPQPQSPLSQNSGLGGFLRNAGTLAAGMAGGEFLAQGLSNLFSPRDW
jgi:uncharacterized protein